jgi:large subunit ribosomal protein L15
MTLQEITSGAHRNKRTQRKGRGRSSNRGKTSGRGGKGSSARQGSPHWVPGHEGGQTRIFKRFPKRGFSNDDFERRFHIVNLSDLAARFDEGATVDAAALHEKGLVPDLNQPVKILGDGEFKKKLTVTAGWYSKSAHQKITAAGGSAQNLKGENFEFPKPKKKFVKREKPAAGSGGGKKQKKGGEEAAPAPEAAAPAAPAAAPAPDAPTEQ